MGQAKRKKQLEQHFFAESQPAVAQVATAIQKLALAASGGIGMDCYVHAAIGQVLLLKHFGIESEVCVGYAAWRVGDGDGDVISHTKQTTAHLAPGVNGLAYHAWLQASDHIIDLTTYQLKRKARDLDALDGGTTVVEWCPPALFVHKNKASTYVDVAQKSVGLFYYEKDQALQAKVASGFELDQEDVRNAEIILSIADVMVIGPNQLPQETALPRQPSAHAAES